MTTPIYKSPKAFRTALETRINAISRKEGVDIQRIRKQISYDRLLARLFLNKPSPWLLKGGYAMQLRVQNARATRDVDIAMKEILLNDGEDMGLALLALLQENVAHDLPDYFEFIVSGPIQDLDAAPYGGARFQVETRVDGRTFEKFHLDVGVGDVWLEPMDTLESKDWLAFAGIPTQSFPAISKEQQFAEKLHAYTLPRQAGVTNSRVKDLVDMVLLISSGSLDSERLKSVIFATFKRRATHEPVAALVAPPDTWLKPYSVLAAESGISPDLAAGFRITQDFVTQLLA